MADVVSCLAFLAAVDVVRSSDYSSKGKKLRRGTCQQKLKSHVLLAAGLATSPAVTVCPPSKPL